MPAQYTTLKGLFITWATVVARVDIANWHYCAICHYYWHYCADLSVSLPMVRAYFLVKLNKVKFASSIPTPST